MKDFYYILGVSRNASQEEIKKAHRKLSQKFHPDKNSGDKFFEDRFKEIQEAYEVLSNQAKKLIYDHNLNDEQTRNHYQANKEDELRRKEEELKRRENDLRRKSEESKNKQTSYSKENTSNSSYKSANFNPNPIHVQKNNTHKSNKFGKIIGIIILIIIISNIIGFLIKYANESSSISNQSNYNPPSLGNSENKSGREPTMSELAKREDSLQKALLGPAAVEQMHRNIDSLKSKDSTSSNKTINIDDLGGTHYSHGQTFSIADIRINLKMGESEGSYITAYKDISNANIYTSFCHRIKIAKKEGDTLSSYKIDVKYFLPDGRLLVFDDNSIYSFSQILKFYELKNSPNAKPGVNGIVFGYSEKDITESKQYNYFELKYIKLENLPRGEYKIEIYYSNHIICSSMFSIRDL